MLVGQYEACMQPCNIVQAISVDGFENRQEKVLLCAELGCVFGSAYDSVVLLIGMGCLRVCQRG